jgi:hypothetical protein
MKKYATWFVRRDGKGVYYHGQVRSYEPNFRELETREWLCSHRHSDRETATSCGQAKLETS